MEAGRSNIEETRSWLSSRRGVVEGERVTMGCVHHETGMEHLVGVAVVWRV